MLCFLWGLCCSSFSFLCCVFCRVRVARLLVFCVVFFVGSVLLIFWFSVLYFLWGLCCSSFSFLCCVFCRVCVARLLVFCVVFFVGSVLLIF